MTGGTQRSVAVVGGGFGGVGAAVMLQRAGYDNVTVSSEASASAESGITTPTRNPNQWPWTATTYRRRTARIDPSAYEVTLRS
ncbi:MAG TPA: FAD-binding protein [Propionibacteriaceae bacterium]